MIKRHEPYNLVTYSVPFFRTKHLPCPIQIRPQCLLHRGWPHTWLQCGLHCPLSGSQLPCKNCGMFGIWCFLLIHTYVYMEHDWYPADGWYPADVGYPRNIRWMADIRIWVCNSILFYLFPPAYNFHLWTLVPLSVCLSSCTYVLTFFCPILQYTYWKPVVP